MFSVVNLPQINQSNYFDCSISSYKNFIKRNINQISLVRMDYSVLILDIMQTLSITNKEEFQALGSVLFNNTFTRERKPILSMEFVDELSDYLIANDRMDSLLSILYVYDIPVFIDGVDFINKLFGMEVDNEKVLLSNELDHKMLNYINNLILRDGHEIKNLIVFYPETYMFCAKDSTTISLDEYINIDPVKIDCDSLLREFYGKGKN